METYIKNNVIDITYQSELITYSSRSFGIRKLWAH